MSRGQSLRALVSERLAAAAEEIFVLFERTIAKYEDELCRCKEENHRKQQLLDEALSPRNVLIPATSPGPEQNQELTDAPGIKDEPKEQVSEPESDAVCVKTEESSLLQQKQTEHREETQGENLSSEPYFHSQTEEQMMHSSDPENDWEPFSWSLAPMETEADGDVHNQDQTRDRKNKVLRQNKSAPETSANSEQAKRNVKSFGCPFCGIPFTHKGHLNRHIRIHTGEKPYSCSVCEKAFNVKGNLDSHMRTHTREKPYSCSVCDKTFAFKCVLDRHFRTHATDRPFSCSVCRETFALEGNLQIHMKTHAAVPGTRNVRSEN